MIRTLLAIGLSFTATSTALASEEAEYLDESVVEYAEECPALDGEECDSAEGEDECTIDYSSMVPYADDDIEDILNTCHVEDPDNCTPEGSPVTHSWTDWYGTCTYCPAYLNGFISTIASEAEQNRPGNSYYIVDYQFTYSGYYSYYGYRYKHTVTYQPMSCGATASHPDRHE